MRRYARENGYAMNETLQTGGLVPDDVADPAALGLLDAALQSIPERYRQAVILRYLQNCSEKEAARRVGCPLGTLSWRASEGIARLRKRLGKLGVATSATALVGLLTSEASAAALPADVVASTCAAANALATGSAAVGGAISAKVAALTDSAMKMLFWAQVKTVAVISVVTVLIGSAGVSLALVLSPKLQQGGERLQASAGETAVASGGGMKRLSSEDAWTKELLARVDAGTWDALDFAKCVTHEKDAAWLVENPGKAGNRLWRTNAKLSNHVLFESVRWKRGVVVGQVMLLPEGNLPAPLAPPPSAMPIPLAAPVWDWALSDQRLGPKLLLYWDAPTETSPSETRFYHRVSVPIAEPGVWCRFAMYFDVEAEEGAVALYRFWPAEGEQAAADGNWIWRKLPITARNTPVGFGLMAHQVPVLWRELKFVPLGPDMPPPPADRTSLTKGY